MEMRLNLNNIFDLKEWGKLQDALTSVTQMAILMVNYKGEPITPHSGCQKFCAQIRKNSEMRKWCQKCDARAGFEAMQDNKPYIYKCHFGLVDIAIPIVVDNVYIGAIMAGQVHVEDEQELEQLYQIPDKKMVADILQEQEKCYAEIPTLSFGRIKVIANLLYYLCNYMCIDSAKKQQNIDICETIITEQVLGANILPGESDGITIFQDALLEDDVKNLEVQLYLDENFDNYHEIIQKAIYYIFQHKGERLTLQNIAEHCHVSEGYLSRLFKKNLGSSYSAYIPHLRISWAKTMLETTEQSITEISNVLGFSESGYFIKTFKRIEGVTPLVYKRYCRMTKKK